MQIKSKVEKPYFVQYDTGDIEVECSRCHNIDKLSSVHAQWPRLVQIPDAYKTYLCFSCWKLSQEEIKQQKSDEREDDIYNGQAFNLAVHSTLAMNYTPLDGNVFWNKVDELKGKFYERLKKSKGR